MASKTNQQLDQKLLHINSDDDEYFVAQQMTSTSAWAGSIKGTIFTLVNSTIGAGLLTLPKAVYSAGWFLGLALLIVTAFLGYYSTFIIVRASHATKNQSYLQISETVGGKYFSLLVKFIFFMANWGYVVSYVINFQPLLSGGLRELLGQGILPSYMEAEQGWFWMTVITLGFVYPLSLFRNLSSLRFICLVGFGCYCYITLVIVVLAFNTNISDITENFKIAPYYDFSGIFTNLSITIFAFTCHPQITDAYEELQRRSVKRGSKVLGRLMSIVCVIYILVGSFGYFTFIDRPQMLAKGNILTADYKGNTAITIAIILLTFALIPSTIINVKPAKDCLLELISPGEEKDSTLKHFMLVTTVIVSALVAAYYAKSLSTVIQLMGSTTSPIMCFTLPCIFFIVLLKKIAGKAQICFAYFMIVLSLVFLVCSLLDFFGLLLPVQN